MRWLAAAFIAYMAFDAGLSVCEARRRAELDRYCIEAVRDVAVESCRAMAGIVINNIGNGSVIFYEGAKR